MTRWVKTLLDPRLTSFTIGGIAYALMKNVTNLSFLAPAFIAMMGTSIMYHTQGGVYRPGKTDVIYYIDKGLAHSIGLVVFVQGIKVTIAFMFNSFWKDVFIAYYWLSYLYVFWVYYIGKKSHLPKDDWKPWHGSIHVAAALGVISLNMALTF
jgi:hypothetical protein